MKKEEIVMGLYAMRLQGKNRVAQERNNTVDRAVELINQLDEPEQTDTNVGLSKPVIPQFVAEWFENDKRDMEIEDVFWQIENCEMVKLDVDRWISDNRNTFIRAWLDGYEVEKEKLYTMAVPYTDIPVHYFMYEDGKMSWKQGNAHKFTWAEIEKHFPEIKDKAKEVTE